MSRRTARSVSRRVRVVAVRPSVRYLWSVSCACSDVETASEHLRVHAAVAVAVHAVPVVVCHCAVQAEQKLTILVQNAMRKERNDGREVRSEVEAALESFMYQQIAHVTRSGEMSWSLEGAVDSASHRVSVVDEAAWYSPSRGSTDLFCIS